MIIEATGSGLGRTPITADSTPDYDSWGPDSYWNCWDWVNWFLALEKEHGTEGAKRIWLPAWAKNGAFSVTEKCPYDSEVVAVLRSKGIDIRTWVSAVVNPIVGGAADIAEGAGDVIKNTTGTAKFLGYAVPIAVTGTVVAVGYYIWKNYLKGDRKVSAYGVEF